MNDEQARKMIDLLTEIRDEMRLVRGQIVDANSPYSLARLLREAEVNYSEMPKSLKNSEAALEPAD